MYQNELKDHHISFVENLNIAWEIFSTNLKTFLWFTLILGLPISLIGRLVFVPTVVQSTIENPNNLTVVYGVCYLLAWFEIFLGFVATCKITEETILGHQINTRSALKNALPRVGTTALIGLLSELIIFVIGFLLFIIPGIYLSILFIFSTYALVLRHCSFSSAFAYSHNLVKGKWWQVLGRLFLTGITFVALAFLGMLVILNLAGVESPEASNIQEVKIIGDVLLTLVTYFANVIFAVYFLNLDYIKNGLPRRA